jgi:hypothetical protein
VGICCAAGLLVPTPAARAQKVTIIYGTPLIMRALAGTDTLLVGKVTSREVAEVEAAPAPGAARKIKYAVVEVQVREMLEGPKDQKALRVAFNPLPDPKEAAAINKGGPGASRELMRSGAVNLTVGQEGLFFLKKHHDENIYVCADSDHFAPKFSNDYIGN